MNREDIIRMAREVDETHGNAWGGGIDMTWDAIVEFAKLVTAAEREECAKISEKLGVHAALNVYNGGPEWYKHGKEIAQAIRAREKNDCYSVV